MKLKKIGSVIKAIPRRIGDATVKVQVATMVQRTYSKYA